MGGYENLIGAANRHDDIRRQLALRKQGIVADAIGGVSGSAAGTITELGDQAALAELAGSMGGEGGAPPSMGTGTAQHGTMETAMAGGELDGPSAMSKSLPPMPNMPPPPSNPNIGNVGAPPQAAMGLPPMPMPRAQAAMGGSPMGPMQTPPMPSQGGMMPPPAAPPQAAARPMAAPPGAPPPMPQSRRPNYAAMARLSPGGMDRAKLMLGSNDRENALGSRESMAGMRESGLMDRAGQLDQRMREIEQMRSGDRRYGVDTRDDTQRRGQDIGFQSAEMRDGTTRRGQDIGDANSDADRGQRKELFGLGDATRRRGQDLTDGNADADRDLKGELGRGNLAAREAVGKASEFARNEANAIRREMMKAKAAEQAGQAQGDAKDRIVRAYSGSLRAVEAALAKAYTEGMSDEAAEVVLLKTQIADLKKALSEGTSAPAQQQGGGVEDEMRKRGLLR